MLVRVLCACALEAVVLTTLAAAPAQQRTPAWLQAIETRSSEAETAASIVSNGKLLYDTDSNKKRWGQYCSSSAQLRNRGEFRKAVREASVALFLGEISNNYTAQAYAARDLAYAYDFAGDLTQASSWASRGFAFQERSGNTSADMDNSVLAPLHKIQGDIALRRGHPKQAVSAYTRALETLTYYTPFKPYIQLGLANALMQGGNTSKSSSIFAELRNENDPIVRATARRGELELALKLKDYAKARQLSEKALGATSVRNAPYFQMWNHYWFARALYEQGDEAAGRSQLAAAIQLAEGLRARFRSEEFKTGFFADVQSVYDFAIETAMDEGRISDAFNLAEMGRARAFADLIRGRARGNGLANPEAASNATAIAAALPRNTALISYFVLPTHTAVWVLRKNGIHGTWIPISARALDAEVRSFRQAIVGLLPVKRSAEALYTQLLGSLDIHEGETLVFEPNKILHFLPFQALRNAKGWLTQSHALAYAPSGTALVDILGRHRPSAGDVLAFGDPAPIDRSLPPLPGAKSEVEHIGSIFPGARVYLGPKATKRRLLDDVRACFILHLAAHATIDNIDPLYSTIWLADTKTMRGALEAREFYNMNLSGVRLVTLSACDSGLGRVGDGDEFWGFERSVLGSGAHALLVSLWPVVDESTPTLMTAFYSSIAKGKSEANSLRRAELTLIGSNKFAQPLYWAPFSLIGDWR